MKKILLFTMLLVASIVAFAQTKTLSFATEATYPPFEYMNSAGQMQGFDVDILKALCQQMQVQCTFSNQAWDSLIPGLQLGKYDAIFGAMNITAEREKQVNFTHPYYANSASIIANKKARLMDLSPRTMKGQIVGVQAGTTFGQYLQAKYGNHIKVNTYASEEAAFLDLTSGRTNAVMGDTPLIMQWLKKGDHAADYMIVGHPINDKKYFGQGYGIAVKKGNKQLLQQLNKALAAIKANGTYDKILQKYYLGTAQ